MATNRNRNIKKQLRNLSSSVVDSIMSSNQSLEYISDGIKFYRHDNNNIECETYIDIDHEHYHDGDSGIDLYCPETITVMPGTLHKIDMKIQCEMISNENNVSYYLYPRSSIVKTPLRMANSIGIIDAGYRGNIIACVDNISEVPYTIERNTRLFQICAPDLSSINLSIVNSLSVTTRGTGGFGSTNEPEPENE